MSILDTHSKLESLRGISLQDVSCFFFFFFFRNELEWNFSRSSVLGDFTLRGGLSRHSVATLDRVYWQSFPVVMGPLPLPLKIESLGAISCILSKWQNYLFWTFWQKLVHEKLWIWWQLGCAVGGGVGVGLLKFSLFRGGRIFASGQRGILYF